MELVQPSFGLIFWMSLSFLIILFLLTKFAWKPILKMIKDREDSIDSALKSAEQAKLDMKSLKAENERILAEARNERDVMLKEARDIKDKIIAEAKASAVTEGERLLKVARESIENEKLAAVTELKNQVAQLSIDIAEKILKAELSTDEKQKTLVKSLLQEVNLN